MPIDQTEPPEVDTPPIGIPTGNLVQSVCRNAAAQLAGRNLISLFRLIAASTIARTFGKEMFGQYSLVIVMLAIAEWLLDFGTSDVFVREICRTPERGARLLRIMTALKLLQMAVASSSFVLLVLLLRYPSETVKASLYAGVSLLFFGGVLIYHTVFKATLTIEREVTAELISVFAMIALLRVASSYRVSLAVIFACHMASRATFFSLCYWFGKARFQLSLKGVTWPDVRWGFHSSAAIGSIGLMVTVYESIDVLLLSKLGSLADVAYYAGAQRFIAPIVVALAAIGGTLYPLAATYWPGARSDFDQSCQRAMDTVFVLAGMAVCLILAGSDFLMRLLGPDLAGGAAILRVLAIVLFAKATSNTLGPVLYVVQAQNQALRLVAVALVFKTALVVALAPAFGYIGVAFAAVITDTATMVATLYLIRKYSGFHVRWAIPLKVGVIALIAAGTARLLLPGNGPHAAVAAVAIFLPLSFLSGSVRLSEVLPLLKWRAP